MFYTKPSIEQTDPPRSPRETLPTMYDLPSEDPEAAGLPDEFHDFQPELLRITFQPPNYPPEQVFSASDMNLYYDVRHPNHYKRPDWFGVVGVPRLYDDQILRLSYVIWQEGIDPFVVVELLSPRTEDEDLGRTKPEANQPPSKWQVYEQILRIPYYVIFSRYTDQLQLFTLQAGRYQEQHLNQPRIWMPELNLGLGVWQGDYAGINRLWLRWYDVEGNWILTETEASQNRLKQAEELLAQERQRAERLAERLRALGINPDELNDV